VFSLDPLPDISEETAALIDSAGSHAIDIACDVGDTDSVSRTFADADCGFNLHVNSRH